MASILVLDDNADLRRMMRFALEAAGYEVADAADVRLGLSLLGGQAVDLVITDLFMPGMDGFETIEFVRKASPGTRIMVISGGLPGGGRADYLAAAGLIGVDATLKKPFEIQALVEAVSGLLGRS